MKEKEERRRKKAEKAKKKKLEDEKRAQDAQKAKLAAAADAQKARELQLAAEREEVERQKRLMRQRSGLEWFAQFYKLACKALDARPCAVLDQIVAKGIKKNKSIYALDLFRSNID